MSLKVFNPFPLMLFSWLKRKENLPWSKQQCSSWLEKCGKRLSIPSLLLLQTNWYVSSAVIFHWNKIKFNQSWISHLTCSLAQSRANIHTPILVHLLHSWCSILLNLFSEMCSSVLFLNSHNRDCLQCIPAAALKSAFKIKLMAWEGTKQVYCSTQ